MHAIMSIHTQCLGLITYMRQVDIKILAAISYDDRLQAAVSEIPSHYDIPSADAAVARRLTSVKYDRKKGLKTAEKNVILCERDDKMT